jgi:site-specific DNA recombinase
MKENARQGFYNGSRLPLGYTLSEGEKRGHRIKKKLVVDPVEAETVKLIYRLYLEGEGVAGPMGVKAVTKTLNENGLRTRLGARYGTASIHKILTNPVYAGLWRFNRRDAKTGREKASSEIIEVSVPAIIEPSCFEKVQKSLKGRSPTLIAPRFVNGPILLSGLAHCASCGGAMTLRTGTSKNGKIHRYYTCSTSARSGKVACKGRSMPMDRLDTLVTTHVTERLLQPDRLSELLSSLSKNRSANDTAIQDRLRVLQGELTQANEKLRRLYKLVEEGFVEMDELLAERIASLKSNREQAKAALQRLQAQTRLEISLREDDIQRLGAFVREKITTGGALFGRAYLRSIVEGIIVDDKLIRISWL